MRIARFVAAGADPAYGIVELAADGGRHPDTIAAISADPLAGPVNFTGVRHRLDEVRLLAPVIPRSKIVAVARNYVAHAAELGDEVDREPLLFLKPNTSVIGPGESIVKPAETDDLHYEGELAVVIGRICHQVPPERAGEVVFGFTCANDVTARDIQRAESQWTRAKGFDTFCPLGPWIAAHIDLDGAGRLGIRTRIDDELRQDGNTADMVHPIAELIACISGFTTLLPGDVILTGTPAGVGPMGPGQQVSVEIDSIGALTNPVIGADDDHSFAEGGPAVR
ncbi:fumarylacetoacetate hydrolase family protein [uncultured Propionibacterium sp.]|uniref:fumarylacetoacetate hydrolase family protein n=1 Tax=uncultured Propionibacterium sp. TaxID=218066 RepID=UPI0029301CBC|nr:fumarylacetoacetate hydrolase family protein [uncultured Propionibacterium sp.]